MNYIFNPLPRDNVANLAIGVEQALQQISTTLNTVNISILPTLTKEPDYVIDGMLCICDGVGFNPLNDGIKRAIIRIDGNWQGVS